MKLPSKAKPYKPFRCKGQKLRKHLKPMAYQAGGGEIINVVYWCRWPSYDFIFGIPSPTKNKFANQEAAFFQFRDTRKKKVVQGFYVDKAELKELIYGFSKCLNIHKRIKIKGG